MAKLRQRRRREKQRCLGIHRTFDEAKQKKRTISIQIAQMQQQRQAKFEEIASSLHDQQTVLNKSEPFDAVVDMAKTFSALAYRIRGDKDRFGRMVDEAKSYEDSLIEELQPGTCANLRSKAELVNDLKIELAQLVAAGTQTHLYKQLEKQ